MAQNEAGEMTDEDYMHAVQNVNCITSNEVKRLAEAEAE